MFLHEGVFGKSRHIPYPLALITGAWLMAPVGLPSIFACPAMTNVNLITIQRVAPSPAAPNMGNFVVELTEIIIQGYLTVCGCARVVVGM